MSLKFEPASEPLQISVKWLSGEQVRLATGFLEYFEIALISFAPALVNYADSVKPWVQVVSVLDMVPPFLRCA